MLVGQQMQDLWTINNVATEVQSLFLSLPVLHVAGFLRVEGKSEQLGEDVFEGGKLNNILPQKADVIWVITVVASKINRKGVVVKLIWEEVQ